MNYIKVIIGIIIFIILSNFIPDVTCKDGWISYSIGLRGACSNHGGVDSNILYVLFFLIISFFGGYLSIYIFKYINIIYKKINVFIIKVEGVKYFYKLITIIFISYLGLFFINNLNGNFLDQLGNNKIYFYIIFTLLGPFIFLLGYILNLGNKK